MRYSNLVFSAITVMASVAHAAPVLHIAGNSIVTKRGGIGEGLEVLYKDVAETEAKGLMDAEFKKLAAEEAERLAKETAEDAKRAGGRDIDALTKAGEKVDVDGNIIIIQEASGVNQKDIMKAQMEDFSALREQLSPEAEEQFAKMLDASGSGFNDEFDMVINKMDDADQSVIQQMRNKASDIWEGMPAEARKDLYEKAFADKYPNLIKAAGLTPETYGQALQMWQKGLIAEDEAANSLYGRMKALKNQASEWYGSLTTTQKTLMVLTAVGIGGVITAAELTGGSSSNSNASPAVTQQKAQQESEKETADKSAADAKAAEAARQAAIKKHGHGGHPQGQGA